jgi:hypothetical protein
VPIDAKFAVIVPVGPNDTASALDTLDSIRTYCPEPHIVVVMDDHARDADSLHATVTTYSNGSVVLKNQRPMGFYRLVWTLSRGLRWILDNTNADIILKLDSDALIIKPGVLTDAARYAAAHPRVGIFGVYEVDYNRPRDFSMHTSIINREMHWWRLLTLRRPPYYDVLRMAEDHCYRRGDNVFAGAYFFTRPALESMRTIALNPPDDWPSNVLEDIYFSMSAVAAGFEMGHFAMPTGPLCLEWQGLPYPPAELDADSRIKLVHSVDKGQHTDGAREYFRNLRTSQNAMRSLSRV